ncbi:MAG: DUF6263 family protein [Planctomycetota bacterium]
MKTSKISKVVVVLALVAAAAAAGAEEKVLIKPKFPPGTYLTTVEMVAAQTVTERQTVKAEQHIKQLMEMKLHVTEPDEDGNKTMELTYERVKQEIKTDSRVIAYDSAGPEEEQNPQLARALSALKKAKVQITIDRDDKIVKVTGLNDLWDELAEQNELMKPLAEKMKAQMGDAMIEKLFKQSYAMMPQQPVGVGESWKSDTELSLPFVGEMKISFDCKLASLEEKAGSKLASITWTATAETEEPAVVEMMGTEMTVNRVDFEQTGKAGFDVETGMVKDGVVDQAGEIDVEVPTPEGESVPMSIKQKAKITTTTRPYVPKEKAPPEENAEEEEEGAEE